MRTQATAFWSLRLLILSGLAIVVLAAYPKTASGIVLTQSLAICEWLEETCADPPLLPGDPITRAQIRAFAMAIACDIHPLQNLKVLRRLRDLGHDQVAVNSWAHDVVVEGLEACEALAPSAGAFLFAAMPTLSEVCLVPQLTNARRFGVDLS